MELADISLRGEEQDSSSPLSVLFTLSKLSLHTTNVLVVGRDFSEACGFCDACNVSILWFWLLRCAVTCTLSGTQLNFRWWWGKGSRPPLGSVYSPWDWFCPSLVFPGLLLVDVPFPDAFRAIQLVSALTPLAASSINRESKLSELLSVLCSVTGCVCYLDPCSQTLR